MIWKKRQSINFRFGFKWPAYIRMIKFMQRPSTLYKVMSTLVKCRNFLEKIATKSAVQ